MEDTPKSPHQSALRRGRASIPGATYFLTICAQRPCTDLACATVFTAFLEQCGALHARNGWQLIALMLMPDHVHLLGKLASSESHHAEVSLGDIVRDLKGPLVPVLRARRLRWQSGGYFDRQMRNADEIGRTLRYMLTNPHRKGLVPWETSWPFWHCDLDTWAWFEPTTNDGRPFPEWVRETSPGSPSSRGKPAPTRTL